VQRASSLSCGGGGGGGLCEDVVLGAALAVGGDTAASVEGASGEASDVLLSGILSKSTSKAAPNSLRANFLRPTRDNNTLTWWSGVYVSKKSGLRSCWEMWEASE